MDWRVSDLKGLCAVKSEFNLLPVGLSQLSLCHLEDGSMILRPAELHCYVSSCSRQC